MDASDPRRALAWVTGAAASVAISACFFDLPDVLDRPAAPATAGTGGGGSGGAAASGGAAPVSVSSGESSSQASAGGAAGAGRAGGGALAWWNPQWTRRVHLTLDGIGAEALTDFPLLVALSPARIDYASTLDDGADLRFVADDGQTVLPHETERWDESGPSSVWVRVPSIPAMPSNGSIWMYFGNPSAADSQDPAGVWASSYAAVYHLGDDPSAPGGKITDSTGHLLDGVAVGLGTADRVPAKVGEGLHYNGLASSGPAVNVAEDGGAFDVPPGEGRTFEIWVARELGSASTYLMKNEGCCQGTAVWFELEPTLHSSFSPDSACCGSNDYTFGYGPFPSDTTWRYIAVVWDRSGAGEMRIHVDGQMVASVPLPQPGPSMAPGTMHLGADHQGNNSLKGTLDEARFAKTALPAGVIQAQFRSMTGQMVTYDAVEELPP